MLQALEALALAEPPPEVEDSLKPDHEWMLSSAKAELESFRVSVRCPDTLEFSVVFI